MNDNFTELLSLCKCSVSLTVNGHRDFYETVEQHFLDNEEELEEIESEVYEKMKELNTIVCVQAYPDTPIGFFVVYHYDINEAVKMVIEAIKRK